MNEQRVEADTAAKLMAAMHAVPGLAERLARGIHVVDFSGDGGESTLTIAAAFPRSRFLGIDADRAVVERARRLTAERRLRNVYWLVAAPQQLAPLPTHDLICAFDGLRHGSEPRAALRAIHAALADGGLYLWSAPNAPGDDGGLRALAAEVGFSRVDTLAVHGAPGGIFVLRKDYTG